MSQRPPHDPLDSRLLRHRSSAAQQRALRKELLLLRAEVERAEFMQAGADLRHAVSGFKWLKLLVPGIGKRNLAESVQHLNSNLSSLVSQYPMLSSLASIALAKPVRAVLRRSAKPLFKWGGLGLMAWQAYRFWKSATADDADAGTARRRRSPD